jgi:hypothetical protein
LFAALRGMLAALGPVELRVTKSQVAFRHRRGFAWAWMPGKYLRGQAAPLVLSVALPERDPSPRWKQIVEPAPRRFMHHLELYTPEDLDDEVAAWLKEAWEAARLVHPTGGHGGRR